MTRITELFLRGTIAAALAATGFSCADRSGQAPGEAVEILVWDFGGVPGHRKWIRQAVKDFNTARDDIRVELETPDWKTQRESLISTTVIGEGPDVIRVHHKYSVEFGELGGLLSLETFSDWPEVRERLFGNVLEHVRHDGKHYGLPVTMLPFVLAANRSILDRYGVAIPRTWEEMKAAGAVLKEHGIHAFTMPAGLNLDTAYRFLPLLYGAGGRVFNDHWTKAAFNGPAGRSALQFLVDLKDAGYMPAASSAYAFDENAAHWTTGQAAFSIEGPWWQDIVRGNFGFDLSQLVLAQVPVPDVPLEKHPPRTLLDVIMVAITAYTPHPQEAWTVLKALNFDDPLSGRYPTRRWEGCRPTGTPTAPGWSGAISDWISWRRPGRTAWAGRDTRQSPRFSATFPTREPGNDRCDDTPGSPDHAAAQVDELLADY